MQRGMRELNAVCQAFQCPSSPPVVAIRLHFPSWIGLSALPSSGHGVVIPAEAMTDILHHDLRRSTMHHSLLQKQRMQVAVGII